MTNGTDECVILKRNISPIWLQYQKLLCKSILRMLTEIMRVISFFIFKYRSSVKIFCIWDVQEPILYLSTRLSRKLTFSFSHTLNFVIFCSSVFCISIHSLLILVIRTVDKSHICMHTEYANTVFFAYLIFSESSFIPSHLCIAPCRLFSVPT